jgi:ABC-type uncharacterized transport system involved in gliding motility auxiliary subunit
MDYSGGGNRNRNFLLQAIDWLGNEDDIVGIQNRESQIGRLDKITDPEKRGVVMMTSQIINVVIIPLLVILAGLFIAWQRKSRNQIQETRKNPEGNTEEKEHSDGI